MIDTKCKKIERNMLYECLYRNCKTNLEISLQILALFRWCCITIWNTNVTMAFQFIIIGHLILFFGIFLSLFLFETLFKTKQLYECVDLYYYMMKKLVSKSKPKEGANLIFFCLFFCFSLYKYIKK